MPAPALAPEQRGASARPRHVQTDVEIAMAKVKLTERQLRRIRHRAVADRAGKRLWVDNPASGRTQVTWEKSHRVGKGAHLMWILLSALRDSSLHGRYSGEVWASAAWMAEHLGWRLRRAERALARLKAVGLVRNVGWRPMPIGGGRFAQAMVRCVIGDPDIVAGQVKMTREAERAIAKCGSGGARPGAGTGDHSVSGRPRRGETPEQALARRLSERGRPARVPVARIVSTDLAAAPPVESPIGPPIKPPEDREVPVPPETIKQGGTNYQTGGAIWILSGSRKKAFNPPSGDKVTGRAAAGTASPSEPDRVGDFRKLLAGLLARAKESAAAAPIRSEGTPSAGPVAPATGGDGRSPGFFSAITEQTEVSFTLGDPGPIPVRSAGPVAPDMPRRPVMGSAIKPAVVCDPPLLDREAPELARAEVLASLWSGATWAEYRERRPVLRGAQLRGRKEYGRLVEACALLDEHEIAPAAWASWSMEVWRTTGPASKRKGPPSLSWTWAPSRVREGRGWFRSTCTSLGGQVIFSQALRDLMAAWVDLDAAVRAAPPGRFGEVLAAALPAYQALVARAEAACREDRARLRDMAARGAWIW